MFCDYNAIRRFTQEKLAQFPLGGCRCRLSVVVFDGGYWWSMVSVVCWKWLRVERPGMFDLTRFLSNSARASNSGCRTNLLFRDQI